MGMVTFKQPVKFKVLKFESSLGLKIPINLLIQMMLSSFVSGICSMKYFTFLLPPKLQ